MASGASSRTRDCWQAGEYPTGQGLQLAQELQRLAARHWFAFEVGEEAGGFAMGRRYT